MLDSSERVLISKRPVHKPGGGLWEFPGGKVEPDEAVHDALCREISEEVGLTVLRYQWMGCVEEASLSLHVYWVSKWLGEAVKREDQLDLCWVPWSSLRQYQFPEANQRVMQLVEEQLDVARQ
ncbi:MAG: NUDIX domain-containing protein [Gammaproteobacteria bacterium]|nr:NUDIX domain-containing protein [Gammaproteobacteria bacterium]